MQHLLELVRTYVTSVVFVDGLELVIEIFELLSVQRRHEYIDGGRFKHVSLAMLAQLLQ